MAYVHWCFGCMNACVKLSGPLELELQTIVSYHVDDESQARLYTPLKPVLWRERQADACEFQDSQNYMENIILKNQKRDCFVF